MEQSLLMSWSLTLSKTRLSVLDIGKGQKQPPIKWATVLTLNVNVTPGFRVLHYS